MSTTTPPSQDGIEQRDFHHPYTPYTIQEQFMNAVYDILERGNGGVGIIESPTGTGKSLSLICASLTWLRDYKRQRFEDGLSWNDGTGDEEPEWIKEAAVSRKKKDALRRREDLEARLKRVRAREKAMRERYLGGEQGNKRRKVEGLDQNVRVDDDEQFLLDEYDSDEEGGNKSIGSAASGVSLSADTLALMEKLGMSINPVKEEEEEFEDEIKVGSLSSSCSSY
jgi:chromosome transmission fidelity protein 1